MRDDNALEHTCRLSRIVFQLIRLAAAQKTPCKNFPNTFFTITCHIPRQNEIFHSSPHAGIGHGRHGLCVSKKNKTFIEETKSLLNEGLDICRAGSGISIEMISIHTFWGKSCHWAFLISFDVFTNAEYEIRNVRKISPGRKYRLRQLALSR